MNQTPTHKISSLIQKELQKLREAQKTRTGNEQFDCGFNLATQHQINFLERLFLDAQEDESELETLRREGKLFWSETSPDMEVVIENGAYILRKKKDN